MKFSVLLPTRNRLTYLRHAVETVLRQDDDDWEVIVSDNYSAEDVAGYVQSLGDPRVKYYRTDRFVPVTDNWNNALDKSSGDYVIMLGDDDGLMKGYFTTLRRLIDEFSRPDAVYTSAFLYSYPNVMPGCPDGFLQPYGYATFLHSAQGPFVLDKKQALDLVRDTMNFRVRFGYNMQFATVSRTLIHRLREKGPFFQSPFPDYYTMNVMLLKAERVLICPYPLVTIGITPKSYGYYHFNHCEAGGIAFLNSVPDPAAARKLKRVLLPGTNINDGWLFAVEAIQANYGSEFGLRVPYDRYRRLQIAHMYEQHYVHKLASKEQLRGLTSRLRWWEWLVYGVGLSATYAVTGWVSPARLARLASRFRARLAQLPEWAPPWTESRYKNILEVFEGVDPLQGLSDGRSPTASVPANAQVGAGQGTSDS